MNVVASDCTTMYAMSRARKRVLIGTNTAPTLATAKNKNTYSGRLPSHRQT